MSMAGSISMLVALFALQVRSRPDCPNNCYCMDSGTELLICYNLLQRTLIEFKNNAIKPLDFRSSNNASVYMDIISHPYKDSSLYLHLKDGIIKEIPGYRHALNSTSNIFYLSDNNLIKISSNISKNCTDLRCLYLDNSRVATFHEYLFRNHSDIYNSDDSNGYYYSIVLFSEKLDIYRLIWKLKNHRGSRSLPKSPKYVFNLFISNENTTEAKDLVIRNIHYVSFSYNLVNFLNNIIFYDFIFILNLDLSNKSIHKIDYNIFKDIERLIQLDLSKNYISVLDYRLFYKMNYLEILDISNNHISFIDYRTFQNTPNLMSLNLSYNKISFLDHRVFNYMSLMRVLNLAGNSIQTIRGDFVNNSKVSIYINIDRFHEIYHVPSDLHISFQTVVLVSSYPHQILDIKNKSSVKSYIFSFCFLNTSPSRVDRNTLRILSNEDSVSQLTLQHLSLKGNSLMEVKDIWITSMNLLETLDISYNRLQYIYSDDFISLNRLSFLDLSHNLLRLLHRNVFNHLKHLKMIDLSANPFIHYSANLFNPLRNLEWVSVSVNGLTVRDLTVINELFELPQLPYISIDKNPICGERFHLTLLLLFYKTYNNEYYNYAYKGHHSCDWDQSYSNLTLYKEPSKNMDYSHTGIYVLINITNKISQLTCSETEKTTSNNNIIYLCPDSCVCIMTTDNRFKHIRVFRGRYSQLKCKGASVTQLTHTLDPNLVKLHLEDNIINNIPGNILFKLTNLQTLKLPNNSIEFLSQKIFHPLTLLRDLDLSGNKLKFIEEPLHILHQQNIMNPLIKNLIPSISAFYYCSELETINLSKNMLELLTCNLFFKQTKLFSLNLSYNKIIHLDSCVFDNASALTYLDLSHNQYQEINFGLFSKFTGLLYLYLSGNQLKQIHPRFFEALPSLKLLNLSKNLLTNLSHNVFQPLKNLLNLNLSDNLINVLQYDIFSDLKKLKYIDLSGNSFHELQHELFINNNALMGIKLARNYIQYLDSNFSRTKNHFNNFDISSNYLSSINYVYSSKTVYVSFNASHNILNKISAPIFPYSCRFQFVDLSHNQLSNLPCGFLKETSHVENIYLNNNNLTTLCATLVPKPIIIFNTFNLSINRINSLPELFFENFVDVQNLYLSHNNLTLLPLRIFGSLRNLKILDLSSNRLDNLQLDTFENVSLLSELDLSTNQLQFLPFNLFRNLYYLTILKINFNHIKCLTLGLFSDLNHLRELDLSANPWMDFPAPIFNNLTNLVSLNLSYTSVSNKHLIMFDYLYDLHQTGDGKMELLDIGDTPACNIKTHAYVKILFDHEYDRNQLKLICNRKGGRYGK